MTSQSTDHGALILDARLKLNYFKRRYRSPQNCERSPQTLYLRQSDKCFNDGFKTLDIGNRNGEISILLKFCLLKRRDQRSTERYKRTPSGRENPLFSTRIEILPIQKTAHFPLRRLGRIERSLLQRMSARVSSFHPAFLALCHRDVQ